MSFSTVDTRRLRRQQETSHEDVSRKLTHPRGVLDPVDKHVRNNKKIQDVSTLTLLLGYAACFFFFTP